MTPQIEDLQEQVRYLRERLADLAGTEDQLTAVRASLGLSPRLAKVLLLLLNAARPVRTEAIYVNVFEHDNGDGPVLECVKVAMCRLRAEILKRSGPPKAITCAFGTGCYSLTPEARQWLGERLQVTA